MISKLPLISPPSPRKAPKLELQYMRASSLEALMDDPAEELLNAEEEEEEEEEERLRLGVSSPPKEQLFPLQEVQSEIGFFPPSSRATTL